MITPPEYHNVLPDPYGKPSAVRRFTHDAMACTWTLLVQCEDPDYAAQAARAAFAEIDRIEQELSRFVPHSDVARINALPAGQPLRVGHDVLACLDLAFRVHAETAGAFDITADAAAGRRGRLTDLQIQPAQHTVTVRAAGVAVDLGGIGKGYAVDQAVAVLGDWSTETALVCAGQSTVYGAVRDPADPGWTVAIRNPKDSSEVPGTVNLRDRALSGSGRVLHGPHIIDPATRRPAVGPLGAWATAASAALSDALSTAFMVMTTDQVKAYCQDHPEVEGLLMPDEAASGRVVRCGGSRDVDESDGGRE
jgi:thiamine biosynthesis lipoprotein